eukprot:11389553-Alexandrium_andersonii.AAC.1
MDGRRPDEGGGAPTGGPGCGAFPPPGLDFKAAPGRAFTRGVGQGTGCFAELIVAVGRGERARGGWARWPRPRQRARPQARGSRCRRRAGESQSGPNSGTVQDSHPQPWRLPQHACQPLGETSGPSGSAS